MSGKIDDKPGFDALLDRLAEKVAALVVDKMHDRQRLRLQTIPGTGTKYRAVLCDLARRGSFSTLDVPEKERHIVSILKNMYGAIIVVERQGRREKLAVAPWALKALRTEKEIA